jgi:hypothetical protein
VRLFVCRDCRRVCLPVAPVYRAEPCWDDVGPVLAYPLARKALPLLLIGVILTFVPIASILFLVCLAGYLVHVLRTSAQGQRHLPDFPQVSDLAEKIVSPLLRLLAAAILAASPIIVYASLTGFPDWRRPVPLVLAGVGVAVYPMLVVVESATGSLAAALSPFTLLRAARAMRWDYLLTLLLLVPLVLLNLVLSSLPAPDLAVAAVLRLAGLYSLLLAFHLLGRLVELTRDRVGQLV